MKFAKPFALLLTAAAALLLVGCAGHPALNESRQLIAEGRLEDGVHRLELAARDNPGDHELRAAYFRQRDLATGQMLVAAEAEVSLRHLDAAQALYQRAQQLDANQPRVREGLAALDGLRRHEALLRDAQALHAKGDDVAAERILQNVLNEDAANGEARRALQTLREQAELEAAPATQLKASFGKPLTLEFRDTPLKTVFEVISRSSGLNFVLDNTVRSDTKVTIFVRNTSVEDLLKLILATNQLERKLVNDNSVVIYPNTPAKVKEYQELVTRSFYLANADVKEAQALVRGIVKTKDVFINEKLNLLVMKDTAAAVRLAARLLESLDIAEPEVMLDVEVLEMTRSKLHELGMRFPDQVGYGLLQPNTNTTTIINGVAQTNTNLGGALATGFVDLRNTAGLTSFVSNPALMLNLKSQAGDGNILANPRIRVKNREKAKIHIGDKVPVFTTTSVANVGVSSSVSYLDVGLKLEVEPNVFLDDDVSIKIGLEVSSIVREVSGPSGSLAYQVGTRTAATVLRLRNGETQVLAGLISDEERSSANRLPGLGDVPLLGRLFSSQMDSSGKTEIILLITPRIVRNVVRSADASATLPAGSDASVGAPVLQIRKTGPSSLSLSAGQGGAARAIAPAPAAAPEPAEPAATPVAPAEEPAPVDAKPSQP